MPDEFTVKQVLTKMRVPPESSGLSNCGKVVQEGVSLGDGTLIDEGGTVCPASAGLEKTVPVLMEQNSMRGSLQ